MKNWLQRTCWIPAVMVSLVCCAPLVAEREWDGEKWVEVEPPQPGTAEGDLAILREMVENKDTQKIVKRAEKYLVKHSGSPNCEEAMCLAGQGLMQRGKYWDAYEWFEKQIATYPNGAFYARALDREFQIGEAYLKGRKRWTMKIFKVSAEEDGIEILTRIATHAPGSPLAEKALLRVGDYYFGKQEYPDAIKIYDDFVEKHSLSNKRPYAMLQAAKANLLSYRGPAWDHTPLLDAAERFRVFAQAYPQAGQREDIPKILEEIRRSLAHKVFHNAEFYERVKRKRPAAYYYRKVMNEYPNTDWDERARLRLERLGEIEPLTPAEADAAAKEMQTDAKPKAAKTPPRKRDDIGVPPATVVTDVAPKAPKASKTKTTSTSKLGELPPVTDTPSVAPKPSTSKSDKKPKKSDPKPIRLEDLSQGTSGQGAK